MTILTTTNDVSGLLPPEYGALIEAPLRATALAFDSRVSTTVSIGSTSFHIPIVTGDPASGWVGEGQQINIDDTEFDELIVTPKKCAAITIVSSELANDSSPAAQTAVGNSIAADIASNVDSAFFGNLSSPAPAGLGSIPALSLALTAASGYNDLDPFAAVIAEMEQAGGTPTSFVTDPATALDLATLKIATGSKQPLLGVDATNGTARQILGVPLLVSRHVTAGTVWALDASTITTVLREGTRLAVSDQAYFDTDRIGIRGTVRVGFGFPVPARIGKITDAASA